MGWRTEENWGQGTDLYVHECFEQQVPAYGDQDAGCCGQRIDRQESGFRIDHCGTFSLMVIDAVRRASQTEKEVVCKIFFARGTSI